MNIEQANTEATERMMEARPVRVGLGKARDVIPDMRDNLGQKNEEARDERDSITDTATLLGR
jgi:hypothetical protein